MILAYVRFAFGFLLETGCDSPASAESLLDLTDAVFIPSSTPSFFYRTPFGSPMTPLGLFGSLGPSLLAFTLHRPGSIGLNLSLNLHHASSTAMSHPSPAHHKPRATSYATVLSITHHTKGANLPWFLNLPLDECIDQHTPQIHTT